MECDIYAMQCLEGVVKLNNADTFEEANEGFKYALSGLEGLARGKFDEIARNAVNEVGSNLHDARVQAQGGV